MKRYFQAGGLIGNLGADLLPQVEITNKQQLQQQLSAPIVSTVSAQDQQTMNNSANTQYATDSKPSLFNGITSALGLNGGVGGILSSIGTQGSPLSTVTNLLGAAIPKNANDKTFNKVMGGIDQVSNMVMMANPIIGGAMKIGGYLFQGINALGSKRAKSMNKDQDTIAKVGAGYGGSVSAIDAAMEKQNTKYGLFNRKGLRKANREITEANRQQIAMQRIAGEATDRFAAQSAMSDMNNSAYAFQLQGGYQDMAVGKKGMKIFSKEQIEHARKVITPDIEYSEVEWIDTFKEGGKLQQNVIPEGALHARLNHMDTENITKKGIPVVTQKDGGEVEQQAEIECNEIILNLDTTKKLEELMSKGDDEAAIEAGKLLAREIMENTDDRTGLIKKVS